MTEIKIKIWVHDKHRFPWPALKTDHCKFFPLKSPLLVVSTKLQVRNANLILITTKICFFILHCMSLRGSVREVTAILLYFIGSDVYIII